jgi:selenide,water dikinase
MFKDVEFPLPPNYNDEMDPYGDEWSNIEKGPRRIDEWMRSYYAMTANLDWNIGRIVQAVDKAGLADETLVARSVACMTTLNRKAAELVAETEGVHACTDVTGFGFLGHALEMAEGSGTGMRIRASSVPVFPGIRPLAEEGIIPGGLIRNRKFREPQIAIGPACPDWLVDVLFDPQTAGGLLIAIAEAEAEGLLARMLAAGIADAAIVGEVTAEPAGRIRIE